MLLLSTRENASSFSTPIKAETWDESSRIREIVNFLRPAAPSGVSLVISLISDARRGGRAPLSLDGGFQEVLLNVNTQVVCSGVGDDSLADGCNGAFEAVAEERAYAYRHRAFISEHQGAQPVTPLTTISFAAINGADALAASTLLSAISAVVGVELPGEHVGALRAKAVCAMATSAGAERVGLALFVAESPQSLRELLVFVRCGLPVLVLSDASDLGALLTHCCDYYSQNAFNFDHKTFANFVDVQLRALAYADCAFESDSDFQLGKSIIMECLANDAVKLTFCTVKEAEASLDYHILRACFNAHITMNAALPLIVKLRLDEFARQLDIRSLIDTPLSAALFEESLRNEGKEAMVSCFLDAGFSVGRFLTLPVLVRLFETAQHQDFLCSVVLARFLGHTRVSHDLEHVVRYELNALLDRIGFVPNLFPCAFCDEHPSQQTDAGGRERAARVMLSVWAVLMNRDALATLLWAYSVDPMPLALTLAQVARSLADGARHSYHYESRMRSLADDLAAAAVQLLSEGHSVAPYRSFDVLCHEFGEFSALTAAELAFRSGNRAFVAHPCCTRWTTRQLFGRLQLVDVGAFGRLPLFVNVLLSWFFIAPLKCGFRIRQFAHHPIQKAAVESRLQQQMDEASCATRLIAPPAASVSYSVRRAGKCRADDVAASVHLHDMSTDDDVADVGQVHAESHTSVAYVPESLWNLMMLFYTTPIAKYWSSLIFRLLHLLIFGYSLSLPGCGSHALDLVVWAWALLSCVEAAWVLRRRQRDLHLRFLGWRVVDVTVTGAFVALMLGLKMVAQRPSVHWGEAFVGRCVCAAFLLYLCYATLFTYIPMSETLGPLLVRVKLMVMRDLANYLLLVALVMASCAVVVHAVVYPDFPASPALYHSAFSWAWFSLFTTDISMLHETDACRQGAVGAAQPHCSATGGYGDPACPRQSWVAYALVIQYLVVLKLISWPLLFALFGKTAKEVDDEADAIWKFQFYALVTEFHAHPPLPPPLTPLCLCWSLYQSIAALCAKSPAQQDHTDMTRVWQSRERSYYSFWQSLAQRYWKETHWNRKTVDKTTSWKPSVTLPNNVAISTELEFGDVYPGTRVRKLLPLETDWSLLLPIYLPPRIDFEPSAFDEPIRAFVQSRHVLPQLFAEWQAAQLGEALPPARRSWLLEDGACTRWSRIDGPLHPLGRVGVRGRGALARYGPNHRQYVLVVASATRCLFLIDDRLPSYECLTEDDWPTPSLGACLSQRREGEPTATSIVDEQLALTASLRVGQSSGAVAHVCRQLDHSPFDTDNAWLVVDVWAVLLDRPDQINGATWKRDEDATTQAEQKYVLEARKLFP